MKLRLHTAIGLALLWLFGGAVGCGRAHEWYPSHAVAPPPGDAREYHSCKRPGTSCPEGWACTKRGCEWCDVEHQTETRCQAGDDGKLQRKGSFIQ